MRTFLDFYDEQFPFIQKQLGSFLGLIPAKGYNEKELKDLLHHFYYILLLENFTRIFTDLSTEELENLEQIQEELKFSEEFDETPPVLSTHIIDHLQPNAARLFISIKSGFNLGITIGSDPKITTEEARREKGALGLVEIQPPYAQQTFLQAYALSLHIMDDVKKQKYDEIEEQQPATVCRM